MGQPKVVEFDPLKRGLPSAITSECEVIGVCLARPEVFSEVRESLKPDDFSTQAHMVIFRRMCSMHDEGFPPDRYAVAAALNEHGESAGVGGMAYLVGALDVPPGLPLDSRIAAIKRDSVRRRAIFQSHAFMDRISEPGDHQQTIADHSHEMGELIADLTGDTGFVTTRQIVERAGGIQEYIHRRRVSGVQMKWGGLNRLTSGLKPEHLFVVAALTSRGKTAFALNVAAHAALSTGVAIFSQEMAGDELFDRFLCARANMDWRTIESSLRDADARARVVQSFNGVFDLPIHIDASDTTTVPAMSARLRKLRAREDIGLVIVDYLQLISGSGKFDSRANEVSSISRGLKRMAKEFSIPVMALSQLNRSPAKGEREPELSDLRESGSIEQDANEVLFLHFTQMWDKYNPVGQLTAILKKNRGGPTGTVPMMFNSMTGVFSEIDTESG